MPDVMGKPLDVAKTLIANAGVSAEIEVSGGGLLGVVVESNWEVCEQSPSAGQQVSGSPILVVERSCMEEVSESSTVEQPEPSPTTSPATAAPTSTAPSSTVPAPEAIPLTPASNPELAAILADGDNCTDAVGAFAQKYRDQLIEFDANIAYMALHGGYETRYDILVYPGDFSETTAVGPSFQFRDVNMFDLNLLRGGVPSGVWTGLNVHVIARVLEFNQNSCLFFIDPVKLSDR